MIWGSTPMREGEGRKQDWVEGCGAVTTKTRLTRINPSLLKTDLGSTGQHPWHW